MSLLLIFIFTVLSLGNDVSSLTPWVGYWQGTCEILAQGAREKELAMSLKVVEVDPERYSWIIQYEGEFPRNYEMKRSAGVSHWVLDEKNGVFIDKFMDLSGSEMKSLYTINGRIFSSVEKLAGDHITFEIRSFLIQRPTQSRILESGTRVNSYQFSTSQICKLKKKFNS